MLKCYFGAMLFRNGKSCLLMNPIGKFPWHPSGGSFASLLSGCRTFQYQVYGDCVTAPLRMDENVTQVIVFDLIAPFLYYSIAFRSCFISVCDNASSSKA